MRTISIIVTVSIIGSIGPGMEADLIGVEGGSDDGHHRAQPRRVRHEGRQGLQECEMSGM